MALALPCLAYLSVNGYWLSRKMNLPTGDEPHYLVYAHSLVERGSLNLEGVYGQAPWENLQGGGSHSLTKETGEYPLHGIGLALLIALPYKLAGVAGAKLFVCLINGLFPLLFFCILNRLLDRPRLSLACALALSLSNPFLMASGQLYPNLLAGLSIAFLCHELQCMAHGRLRSLSRALLFGFVAGFLPWLHHRHLFTGLALDLVYGLVWLLTGRKDKKAFALSLALLILLQAGEAGFTFWLHGSMNSLDKFSTVSVGWKGWYSVMILCGLHLDQSHGLFFQNPLLLLGICGLPLMCRANRPLFLAFSALYGLLLAPVCLSPFNYGGHAYLGRYQWDFAPLWVFPAAFFLQWMSAQAGQSKLLRALLLASIGLQGVWLMQWIGVQEFFIMDRPKPLWNVVTLYDPVRWFLPSFVVVETFRQHAPNWLAPLAAGILALSGHWWTQGRGRSAERLWIAFGILAGCCLPQEKDLSPLVRNGASGGMFTGHNVQDVRLGQEGVDAPGWVYYGAWTWLYPGSYRLTLYYDAAYPTPQAAPTWGLVANVGRRSLEGGSLPPSKRNHGVFTYAFSIAPEEKRMENVEFRIRFSGQGFIRIKKIILTPER